MNRRHRLAKLIIPMVCFIVFLPLTKATGQITPPEEVLGFKPGADFHLITYEQAIGYLERIATQSDRIRVFDMGPTSYGRRMKYAVISSEQNMANLDHYKEINAKLSLVRGVSEEEAEQLAEQGKAVVWIDVGLHASETSPAQHAAQLVYDIVTGSDRRTSAIRENDIFVLVFANPDGMTMVSEWYTQNLGTPYERSRMPELYQKYAGHDNNRDSFIANLKEVQNMNRATCHEWFPEILFNMHETAPFPARIWIPPESEPMNPNQHPIIVRWKNLIGSAMGKAFEEAEQPGAISRISFDSWYPGYATQFVDGHNTSSILTETANFGYATPNYYTIYDFPESHRDLVKGVFYPNPWPGGWWRLSDAVAYNLTASKAILEVAAKYRVEFLYNKWKIGRDVIDRFKKEPPYGWIISADQTDQYTTALMLDRCILNGIEIYRSEEAFEHNGIAYPKGSHIIPTSQPFGLFVKHIFEKQEYPDLRKYAHLWQGIVGSAKLGKEPIRAYDGVGWTLPIQMGIDCQEMSAPLEVKKTWVTQVSSPAGNLRSGGSHYVFSSQDNGSFIAVNRILKAGGKVSYALADFSAGGQKYPAGAFIVDSGSIPKKTLEEIASDLHIRMVGGKVEIKSKPIRKSRTALYKSWVASMDAGWINYLFDQYEFPYHLLTDAEVKAGRLHDRFDVIVLPDQSASSIIEGHTKGTMPPDFVGGISTDGADNLKAFVQDGGTLVCNSGSCDLPIEQFRFPIKNVLKDVKPDSFSCPGSLLKMDYNTDHPLTFGMQKRGIAFFSRDWAFEIIKDSVKTESKEEKQETKEKKPPEEKPKYVKVTPQIVATLPDEPLLVSGWILGDKVIREKAAILDVPFGKGRAVLFGFNVQNRAQTHATFKLLFNALYY